jgi:hypothetical protein
LDYPTSCAEVAQWFAEQHPQVKASTIRAHIVGLTANDRSRHHYASLARREPLFTRRPDGSLEDFILANWEGIDWGRPLELWESETGELGHQLATQVGRLDSCAGTPRQTRSLWLS